MTKRNQPCPCGSKIKYKKCCGNSRANSSQSSLNTFQQVPVGGEINNFSVQEHGKNNQNKPESAQDHYNQGCSYVEINMLEDAVVCFQKALSLQPAAEVYYNLAIIQERLGNLIEAIDSFQEALRLRPELKIILLSLGYLFLKTANFQKAIDNYTVALSDDPSNAETYNNLGVALKKTNLLEEAAGNFRQALLLKTDYDEAYVNLGVVLSELGKPEEAADCLHKSLAINPQCPATLVSLGSLYKEQSRYEEACECFHKALSIDPKYYKAIQSLGAISREKGNIEEALASFRKVLTLNPNHTLSHLTIASLRKYSGDEKQIDEMESLFSKKELNEKQRMYLAFGLAKAYEDSGKYEKAFKCLLEGNKLKRETLSYSEDKMKAVFVHIKKVFSKSFVSTNMKMNIPENNPIFILGMPRSGTSLVEQILASHSSVYGAGELRYISQIINHACKSNNMHETLKHIEGNYETTAPLLGDEYIKMTHELSASAKHITDKMPDNFLWLGMIHLALPNAKIIHCKRDPMDNCLSIFKNIFQGHHNYAYDMHELGNYYLLYKDLMHHWRDVFSPEAVYDISYEKLIDDQERETRNLLQYCELPWEDNCLSFHKTSRIVATASAVQVRKPIYRDSVQLWRKYERQLEPLQRILSGKP